METDLNFTKEKITEMMTWPHFDGFTAAQCGQCKKTANVMQGPGWFCPCGMFNSLPWGNMQIPHEKPDYGPTRQTITEALALSRAASSGLEGKPKK